MLDEDQALRQANAVALDLALGFDDAARAEASRNVTRNPQSGIAHRAYGDALAGFPRADAARRSEYLQAQLSAPLGTPAPPLFLSENVQRSGFEAPQHGFFRAAEPGQIGLNDYGAAFKTKPWQVQAEGTVAGQDTRGGQIQISGSTGPIGWSLSQLQFKTDGFGEFNRLDNSVLRANLQADITASTRLMIEAQQFSSERQDVLRPAEPFFFSPQDISEDRYRYRLALRQKIGDNQEVLLLDTSERSERFLDFLPTAFNGSTEPFPTHYSFASHTPELQYRLHSSNFRLVLGSRYNSSEAIDEDSISRSKSEFHSQSHYAYAYAALPYGVELELGASLDKADNTSNLSQHKTNPKFGLRWEFIPGGVLRLASFRAVNDAFLNNASLEPTQLAGFHQVFGDPYGTLAYRRGIAWDQRVTKEIAWGIEASARDLQVPLADLFVPWDERQQRAFVNWSLPRGLLDKLLRGTEGALALSYEHEHFIRDSAFPGDERLLDYRLRQLRLGLTLKHASGWAGNIGISRVQTAVLFGVTDSDEVTPITLAARDRFWSADAALTYRLPGKLGQISVGALNALNRRGFQYVELDSQNPRYAPERLVYGKLQLNF